MLEAQFDADNKPIQDADFDNETCKLDVLFNPEKEVVDPNLEDLENLNLDFFSMFTDEYVRRNIVLTELSDINFMELLDRYSNVLDIILFKIIRPHQLVLQTRLNPVSLMGPEKLFQTTNTLLFQQH